MIDAIKNKYYRFQPGEFLPVYDGGVMTNKRQFHAYRIKKMVSDPRAAFYQFTHFSS